MLPCDAEERSETDSGPYPVIASVIPGSDCDEHACEVENDCASSSTESVTVSVTLTRTGTPIEVDGDL